MLGTEAHVAAYRHSQRPTSALELRSTGGNQATQSTTTARQRGFLARHVLRHPPSSLRGWTPIPNPLSSCATQAGPRSRGLLSAHYPRDSVGIHSPIPRGRTLDLPLARAPGFTGLHRWELRAAPYATGPASMRPPARSAVDDRTTTTMTPRRRLQWTRMRATRRRHRNPDSADRVRPGDPTKQPVRPILPRERRSSRGRRPLRIANPGRLHAQRHDPRWACGHRKIARTSFRDVTQDEAAAVSSSPDRRDRLAERTSARAISSRRSSTEFGTFVGFMATARRTRARRAATPRHGPDVTGADGSDTNGHRLYSRPRPRAARHRRLDGRDSSLRRMPRAASGRDGHGAPPIAIRRSPRRPRFLPQGHSSRASRSSQLIPQGKYRRAQPYVSARHRGPGAAKRSSG